MSANAQAPLLLFSIPDKDQEQAFQLQYHAAAVLLDPLLSFLGLISHVLKQAVLGPGPAAPQDSPFITSAFWFRTAILAVQLLAIVLLSKPQCIMLRGPLTTWHKLVFVAGSGFGFKRGSCGICPMLWRHRCLLIHATSAVARVPAGWYWQGASACWLLATLIDAASPAGEAGGSAVQAFTRVFVLLSKGPSAVVSSLTNSSTVCSAMVNAAGLALPGVVLTYMEVSQRRAWLDQQQQQPAGCEAAAAAAAAATEQQPVSQEAGTAAAATDGVGRSAAVGSEQQECVGGACGTPPPLTLACTLAAAAAVLPQESAAATAARLSRSKETVDWPIVETASSTSSDSASSWSEQSTDNADANTPAAAAAVRALTAAGSGAAAVQFPFAPYQSALARRCVSIKLRGPLDTGAQDLQLTRARLAAVLPQALTAVLDNPAEGATAAAAAAVAAGTLPPPSLPGLSNPGQAAAVNPITSYIWPAVTQAVAFRGCYQFVFELVQPAAAAVAAETADPLPQLQQAVADQLLPGWTVVGVQLHPATEELQQQQSNGELLLCSPGFLAVAAAAADMHLALRPAATTAPAAVAAVAVAEAAAAAAEAAAAAAAAAQPGPQGSAGVMSELHSNSGGSTDSEHSDTSSSSSGSSSSSSSSALGSTALVADLLVPHQRVLQLHQDGHQHVRVVLLSHPPGHPLGAVLLDKTLEVQVPLAGGEAGPPAQLQLKVDLQQWQAVHNIGHVVQAVSGDVTSDLPTPDDTTCQALSVVATLAAAAAGTAAAAAADGILAHLPLLLLPAKAADELQLLLMSAMTAGMQYCAAYHLLLPLLQDWALVMLLGSNGNADAAGAGGHDGLREQMGQAVDALACYFTKHEMPECLRVLQAAAGSSSSGGG